MNDGTLRSDPDFIDEDVFPVLEGIKMCPRCKDCSVGVGPYKPPVPLPGPRFLAIHFIPSMDELVPGPLGDAPQARFCKGGCDEKGKHSRPPGLPSFIGRVR